MCARPPRIAPGRHIADLERYVYTDVWSSHFLSICALNGPVAKARSAWPAITGADWLVAMGRLVRFTDGLLRPGDGDRSGAAATIPTPIERSPVYGLVQLRVGLLDEPSARNPNVVEPEAGIEAL